MTTDIATMERIEKQNKANNFHLENTKKLNEARNIFKSSSGLDNITEFNMSKFKYIMNGN
jgi:phage anti-repressor protein